ncbi:unnamed protein product [Allacma fusca]|uniref:Uncharacterized protein n=1 Tax=Allacma fusca TaxID=39272 RepID=A0A8J2KPJ9_9HEXA|nr:unnamed protein product [Allacma fusca]
MHKTSVPMQNDSNLQQRCIQQQFRCETLSFISNDAYNISSDAKRSNSLTVRMQKTTKGHLKCKTCLMVSTGTEWVIPPVKMQSPPINPQS